MAKGDGSIQQVGRGKWRVFVSLGKDPVTGEYKRVTKTVRGTKAEARKARDEMRRDGQILDLSGASTTFLEFAREYNEKRASLGDIGENQRKRDTYMLGLMAPYLGTMKLGEITPAAVESFYVKLKNDRGLGGTTMAAVHQKLKHIMKTAENLGYIVRNPCDKVTAPKKDEPKRRALDAVEAARLLSFAEAAEAAETSALMERQRRQTERGNLFGRSSIEGLGHLGNIQGVRIALATGMRLGEVCALAWDCVDLEAGYITVRRSLTQGGTLKTPKSKSGIRRIAVDAGTMRSLARWKPLQASQLLKIGVRQTGETPVCSSRIGGFNNLHNFESWWRSFRKEAGFPDLKFHELRHTQATQLLANGVDVKTVQERMGHANASITLNWYAHALPENDRKAAALMGNILNEHPKEARIIEAKTA